MARATAGRARSPGGPAGIRVGRDRKGRDQLRRAVPQAAPRRPQAGASVQRPPDTCRFSRHFPGALGCDSIDQEDSTSPSLNLSSTRGVNNAIFPDGGPVGVRCLVMTYGWWVSGGGEGLPLHTYCPGAIVCDLTLATHGHEREILIHVLVFILCLVSSDSGPSPNVDMTRGCNSPQTLPVPCHVTKRRVMKFSRATSRDVKANEFQFKYFMAMKFFTAWSS